MNRCAVICERVERSSGASPFTVSVVQPLVEVRQKLLVGHAERDSFPTTMLLLDVKADPVACASYGNSYNKSCDGPTKEKIPPQVRELSGCLPEKISLQYRIEQPLEIRRRERRRLVEDD